MKAFIEKHKILLGTLLINVIAFAVFLLIAYPRFENQLDIMMMAGSCGSGTDVSTAHILFQNIIIGDVFKLLYSLMPRLPWYWLGQVVVCFIGLTQIGYTLFERKWNASIRILYYIVITFVGYECYMRPSYIKTAVLATAAAIFSMGYVLLEEKTSWKKLVLFVFELILASMICMRAFVISACLSFVILLVYWTIAKVYVFKNKELLLQVGIILLTVVVLSCVLSKIDNMSYQRQEYERAQKYRSSVERVLGFGYEPYSEDVMEELALEKPEHFYNIINGIYISKDDRALDITKQIANMRLQVAPENILSFFRTVPIRMFRIGMFYCCLILFVLLCVSNIAKKKLFIITSIVLLLGETMVLYFLRMLDRQPMELLSILPIAMFLLLVCQEIELEDKKTVWVYLVVIGIILYNRFGSIMVTNVTDTPILEALDKYYIWNVDDANANKKEKNKYLKAKKEDIITAKGEDGEEHEFDTREHQMNLIAFLGKYSAYEIYPKNLCMKQPMVVVNGVMGIMPGFEEVTNVDTLNEHMDMPWAEGSGKMWKRIINYEIVNAEE